MNVILLKVKHIWDEDYEECGIFTSEDNMEAAKKEFIKAKKKEGFKADEYRFRYSIFELDKLQ